MTFLLPFSFCSKEEILLGIFSRVLVTNDKVYAGELLGRVTALCSICTSA